MFGTPQIYQQRAEQLEALARTARNTAIARSYENLARGYRQLAFFVSQPLTDGEAERRIG
jgi:hypothetical protein